MMCFDKFTLGRSLFYFGLWRKENTSPAFTIIHLNHCTILRNSSSHFLFLFPLGQINSEPLRQHIKGKWVQVVDKITKCLNRLLDHGFSRRRNYILDQVRASTMYRFVILLVTKLRISIYSCSMSMSGSLVNTGHLSFA